MSAQEHACGTEQESDIGRSLCGLVAWWSLGRHVPITDLRIQLQPPPDRIPRRRQVGTRGQLLPVRIRFNMDGHLQGAAALHAPCPTSNLWTLSAWFYVVGG